MIEYYASRALEYEAIYKKPERQNDLRQIELLVSNSFNGLDVLEIACGTGYWTRFAALSAMALTATDYNNEVLEIARNKKYSKCQPSFVKDDAYALTAIKSNFTGALVGFWLSHVPKSKLNKFFNTFHSKLSDNAKVIIIDNKYVKGSSTDISRTDMDGNTYQIRQLKDGQSFEVLKNFVTETVFRKMVTPFSECMEFDETEYFWIGKYRLKR